tara:strand:+ start:1265 stop:1927 length:663 start_codon:yes stop_codon:yes gene_type:complete
MKFKIEKILKKIEEIKTNKTKAKKIHLIAVTKNQPLIKIKSAIENGIYMVGENKVQEAEKKYNKIEEKIEKHFIGHLQRNKVKKAIKIFDVIQTVDTPKLINKINKIAKEQRVTQKIMLQINTGKDEKKYGFETEEIYNYIEEFKKLKNVIIIGIMTIAPKIKDKKKLINIFKTTKEIQKEIQKEIKECKYLSMGMSEDYVEAIKAGATHIRIGTAIFGK